jgi:hypothetical protein
MEKKLNESVKKQLEYLNYLIDTNETTVEVLRGMHKWIEENGFVTEKQNNKISIETKKIQLAIEECKK